MKEFLVFFFGPLDLSNGWIEPLVPSGLALLRGLASQE